MGVGVLGGASADEGAARLHARAQVLVAGVDPGVDHGDPDALAGALAPGVGEAGVAHVRHRGRVGDELGATHLAASLLRVGRLVDGRGRCERRQGGQQQGRAGDDVREAQRHCFAPSAACTAAASESSGPLANSSTHARGVAIGSTDS